MSALTSLLKYRHSKSRQNVPDDIAGACRKSDRHTTNRSSASGGMGEFISRGDERWDQSGSQLSAEGPDQWWRTVGAGSKRARSCLGLSIRAFSLFSISAQKNRQFIARSYRRHTIRASPGSWEKPDRALEIAVQAASALSCRADSASCARHQTGNTCYDPDGYLNCSTSGFRS